jgi:hypothetical protein
VLSRAGNAPLGVGRSEVVTVTLPVPAPSGGITVTVASDNDAVASIEPPGTAFIGPGQSVGTVTVTGESEGTVTLRANASGYLEGTLDVPVTVNLISTPSALTVPFGLTTELPVSIGADPAPAGGLTIDVSSADPAVVEVVTPQVTIPEGSFSANATVRGLQVGSAAVTASHPQYSPSTTPVSSSAQLNIVPADASFNEGLPGPSLTVRLESNGTPVAAQPALTVALSSGNTACVTVPASVTIPAGLVSATFQPAYGGSAALPCTATVTATADNLSSDTVAVTVNTRAGFTNPGTFTIGARLMAATTVVLGSAQHGGRDVSVRSNDPSRLLVSPDATTPGTPSFVVNLKNGESVLTYYMQGIENTAGPATVTVSAEGFTDMTHEANVSPSAIEIVNLLSPMSAAAGAQTSFYVAAGVPCAGNSAICQYQNVRPGGPDFVVTLTNSDDAVARLTSDEPAAAGQSVSKPIRPGVYYTVAIVPGSTYGITFEPLGSGTTTVTATGPADVVTTSTGVRQVVVEAPKITGPGTTTVGAGLMHSATASLGGSAHGGVLVTFTSSDPDRVRVSPDTATPGAASFSTRVDNGQAFVSYYVHGLENTTGRAEVTISAEGFDSATHTVDLAAAGVEIVSLDPATSTLSAPDTDFYAAVGLPCPGNTSICQYQNVRTGGPAFVVTLTNSDARVGRLRSDEPALTGQAVTKPIQPGFYYTQAVAAGTFYGLAFDPLGNGTTAVSVAGPAGVLTMTTTGNRQVTVSAPSITAPGNMSVGAGLMVGTSAFLSAAQHGGINVTVRSADPSRVLVAPDAATPGAAEFTSAIPNGQTYVPYYVQGLENVSGAAQVTVLADAFTSGSHTATVAPAGVELQYLDAATTVLSPEDVDVFAAVGVPCTGNSSICQYQAVRAGGPPFIVTLANSDGRVGRLRSDEPALTGQIVTKPIRPGYYYTQAVAGSTTWNGLAFDPLSNGTTTVTVTGPAGVVTMSSTGVRPVTVSTPGIQANAAVAVGAGLQSAQAAFLGASGHGGLDVTITSSAPSVVQVAPDGTTAGSASIDVPVANGQTYVPFVIHGVEGGTGTATVTLSAPGFTSASIAVTVEAGAIEIVSLYGPFSASDPDQVTWYVQTGLPSSNGTTLREVQTVRGGSRGVTVTLTNTNAAAAQLGSDEPVATGQTVTKPINPGYYYPTAVLPGTWYGLRFEILGAGTTTVAASAPGMLQTTGASRTIVINP